MNTPTPKSRPARLLAGQLNIIFFRCLLLAAVLLTLAPASALATAYVASVSGNWNSSATWGGSGPPTSASDTITINTGITVTVSDTEACTSIVLNRTTGNTTKLAVNTGGTLTLSSTITQSGSAGTASVDLSAGSGTLILNLIGTPLGSSVTLTCGSSGSTVKYTGAGAQTMNGGPYANLTVGGGAKATSVTVNGTLTMLTGATFGSNPTFGASASVVYDGFSGTASREWNTGDKTITVQNGSTVTGSGTTMTTTHNITVNSGCTVTLSSGVVNVNTPGILDLSGTLDITTAANNQIAGTGSCTVENGGILKIDDTHSLISATIALEVKSGGIVQELKAAGQVPTATWDVGSTLQLLSTGTLIIPASQTFANVTVNTTACTINTVCAINGTLTLTAGTLTVAATKPSMASGSTIVRTAGALSGTPTFSGTVNVTYNNTSATTTGTELPTGSSALNNLTINNTAGVILNAAATVNGTFAATYNGSTVPLAAGANTLAFVSSPVNLAVTGSALANGVYTIVSSSASSVSGALGTVTVTGVGAPYSPAPVASASSGQLLLGIGGPIVTAPSVTTQAASGQTATGATLNGTVTSDGGSALTQRGFYWKTSPGVTTSDTQIVEGGTSVSAFASALGSLSVNTIYYYRAFAVNAVGTTLAGSDVSFYTLANVPNAPVVVGSVGPNTLTVAIGSGDGNPATTTYAIQETAGSLYVQASGALGASPVYQTASTWGTKTVTGLTPATTYTFQVKARNGALTDTAFSSTASGTTTANSASSDIVTNAGFVTTANIPYASYQEASLTASSLAVGEFIVRDGGATSPDADSLPTTLTNLSFTVVNSTNLQRVGLFDGATKLAEVAGGPTVTFSGISVVAPDDGTKTITLRASFSSVVTDNKQFSFTVSSATADPSGSAFAAVDAGGAMTSTNLDDNRIEVTATKLAFTTIPGTNVNARGNFTVTVKAVDALTNADLDVAPSVTLSLASGSGTLSSVAGLTQSLVSGSKNWTDLRINIGGTFTLQAVDGASLLTTGISGNIIVNDLYTYRTRTGFSSGNWSNTNTWDYSLDAGSTWTPSASFTPDSTAATGPIEIRTGNVTEDLAALTLDEVTVDATATLSVPSANALTIATGGLTISANGTLACDGALVINASSGITNNGTVNYTSTTVALAGTGTFVQGANATLNYAGPTVTNALQASASGNTVAYNAAGAQTCKGTSYQNLTLSGSGQKTTGSVTVNGILTMKGSAQAFGSNPSWAAGSSLVYDAYSGTGGREWNTPSVSPITVQNGSSVTGSGTSLSTTANITVNSGCTLTIPGGVVTVNTPGVLDIAGTLDITANANNQIIGSGSGIVENGGILKIDNTHTVVSTSFALAVNSGGIVQVLVVGGEVPTATWNAGSTLQLLSTGTPANVAGQSFANVTVNTTACTVGGACTINGKLTLTAGTVSSANNITMASGSAIVRTAGSLLGTPTFGTTVDVTYNDTTATTTGTELPTSGTVLNNLTINNAAGVTLTANMTINGTFATIYDGSTVPLVAGSHVAAFVSSSVNITNTGGTLANGLYTIVSSTGSTVSGTLGAVAVTGTGAPYSPTPTASTGTGQLVLNIGGIITPPTLVSSVSGGVLTFSWTGAFKLQSQTNNLTTGLGTTWFDYPGGSTSPVNVTVDPASPSVFFRLSQ